MWPTYSDNVSHKVSISIYILTAKILKKHTSSVTTEESGNKTVATKPRTTCATCCHNLQHQNLLRDKLRAKVVIPATTLYNFQCNNVALQVERKCCPYYLTVTCFATLLQNDLNSDVASLFQSHEIVVKSSSVKRNAKNARGLGKDRAPPCPFFPPPPHPFPSRARLIFALLVLIRPHYIYYLRAWHRLRCCAFY